MTGGRPSKLPVSEKRILADIRAGCFPEQAAQAAGVSPSAFYAWKARGQRESDGPYHRFVRNLRQAEAEAERNAVNILRSAIEDDGDWKAALAFLERRYPGRWRRHQTNELVGPDGGPIQTESTPALDLSRLNDRELKQLKRLYERASVDRDRS
jgi:hypothetical protein